MSETSDADQRERDMLSMFASVWVKVEVEDDSNMSYEVPVEPEIVNDVKKKTPPRRKSKTLKCNICDYTTAYKNCLDLHILGHTNSKPYSCDTCNYTTKYPTSLQRHVLIQHEFKKSDHENEAAEFKCDQCPYTSFFKWNLKAHKRKHKLEKQFKCEHCSYATAYRHNYIKHNKVHNKQEVIFKCDKCAFVTKFEGHISRHLAKIHNEVSDKANKCDLCDFSTKVKWRLNIHKQRSKQNDVLKCSYCEFETSYMCESKKHKVTHYSEIYGSKINEINEDTAIVTNFESLPNQSTDSNQSADETYKNTSESNCEGDWQKMQAIESSSEEPLHEVLDKANKCDLCDFSTDEKWRLDGHKFKSKQNDVLKCSYCVFETNYMCELKKHKTTHYNVLYGSKNNADTVDFQYLPNPSIDSNKSAHEQNNYYTSDSNCEVDWKKIKVIESSSKDRPFQCIMCSYISRFKASVQRHFQRHHTGSENRPYKCCNCDFSTKTKDQISLHNKRSRSEVQITCGECAFTTFFKCQYAIHQKCHYAHKCNICGYSCKHKYEFQKHFSLMHMGSGLKCRFCDYKALRKESLLCHETIHTGNKPFKCSYCDYKSVRKSLLDNHMKRYHSDVKRNMVIVSESKIESLKIAVGDKVKNPNIIQDIRDQNISIEDLLNT